MFLAAANLLSYEQIQLLANCFQPVQVPRITGTSKVLIDRKLGRSFGTISKNKHKCIFLVATDRGRAYVTAWIRRQERLLTTQGPSPSQSRLE